MVRIGRARCYVLVTFGCVLLGTDPHTTHAQDPPAPEAPFAAVQFGTNGCIEVGARPDPPYNQPRPTTLPVGYDIEASGYPAFGYDASGYGVANGLNACRYNFRDSAGTTIGSGYCVQFGKGQRSGTGYDPLPWDGTIRNDGYVRRILQDYWPAQAAPAVPGGTNQTVLNRNRSGAVAMAIHFFTDGVVMPPNYQVPALFDAVAEVVSGALAAGPLPEPPDPTPSIGGPIEGVVGGLIGPYTVALNAAGPGTVSVSGGDAFTDAGGTQPFPSGSTLPPGGQLWVRAGSAGVVTLSVLAPVLAPVLADVGTLMVGDSTYAVQSMALAVPLTLDGQSSLAVTVTAPSPPVRMSSNASAAVVETGASVFDSIEVLGLPGDATLVVTLYGPRPPGPSGSCLDAAWDASPPVLRTLGPDPVPADHRYVSVDVELTVVGCYSFGATLDPNPGPDVVMAPGEPSETVRVVPPTVLPILAIGSQASANAVPQGASVHDVVNVTGLLPGRSMTLVSMLYGPVTLDANGTCEGVDWVGIEQAGALPVVVAYPPVTLTGSGSYSTPDAALAAAGCYSFGAMVTHDMLTGGEEPSVQHLGLATQVVQVQAAPTPTDPPTTTSPPAPAPPPSTTPSPPTSTAELPPTGTVIGFPALLASGAALIIVGALAVRMRRRPHTWR